MGNDTVEKLALIFVQKNADAGITPAQLYSMYKKAVEEIRDAESKSIEPAL